MGRAAGWGRSRAHACEHGPQRSLRAVSVRAPARGVGLASRLHLCRLQGRACACGCECELGDERAWACRVSVPVARECESPACCAPGCGVGGGEEAPGTWSGPPGERPRAPSGVTTQRASGRPTPLPARPGFTYVHLPPEGRAPRRGFPGEGAPRLRWGACEPQAGAGPPAWEKQRRVRTVRAGVPGARPGRHSSGPHAPHHGPARRARRHPACGRGHGRGGPRQSAWGCLVRGRVRLPQARWLVQRTLDSQSGG